MRQTPRHTCITRHESNRLQGLKILLGGKYSHPLMDISAYRVFIYVRHARFKYPCRFSGSLHDFPCSPCRFSILQTHMEYQRGVFPLKRSLSETEFLTTCFIHVSTRDFGFALSAVTEAASAPAVMQSITPPRLHPRTIIGL